MGSKIFTNGKHQRIISQKGCNSVYFIEVFFILEILVAFYIFDQIENLGRYFIFCRGFFSTAGLSGGIPPRNLAAVFGYPTFFDNFIQS